MFEFHSSEYRVGTMYVYTAFQPVDHGDTRYDKAQTISPVQVQVQVRPLRRVYFLLPDSAKINWNFFWGRLGPARRWAYVGDIALRHPLPIR